MRKIYIFLFAIFPLQQLLAQDSCEAADSNLIYAYSNIKSAYESNNLDHLKYYTVKSLKSSKEAKINLKKCTCENAYNVVYDATELLAKVETQRTFEDGRFYIKRAKELVQNGITILNEFTAKKDTHLKNRQNTNVSASSPEVKTLEKEKLIKEYEEAITLNIQTYNELLKLNGSDNKITKSKTDTEALLNKSINEIKAFYMVNIKNITSSYLDRLNNY